MNHEEKIRKLCDKAGVSREEADTALNACNDDILDAMLYLEALGKVRRPSGGSYTTGGAQSDPASFQSSGYSNSGETNRQGNGGNGNPQQNSQSSGSSFATELGKLVRWIGDLLKKGMVNYLDVTKDGNCNFSIPLTVLVFLFIPFFWIMTVLCLVLLLCGYRYEFRGPNFRSDDKANQMLHNAADACSNVKDDFKKGYGENTDNRQ